MTSRRALPGMHFFALVAVVAGLGLLAWLLLFENSRANDVAHATEADEAARAAALADPSRADGAKKTDAGTAGEVERSSEEVAPPPPPPTMVIRTHETVEGTEKLPDPLVFSTTVKFCPAAPAAPWAP
jgi:hypothetical protein